MSFRRPTTTFTRWTQSQAITQSIAFSPLSDQWDIIWTSFTFFFIFSKLFLYNYCIFYHGDQKISWWIICRWRSVNFEIHLCSSGMNSGCFWRSISIQYVQIEPGVNSDLGNGFFWVEIRDAIKACVSTCRSTQVKIIYKFLIASTDLWPQEMYIFWKRLRWLCLKAVTVPTSVTRGLRGSTATGALVLIVRSHATQELV